MSSVPKAPNNVVAAHHPYLLASAKWAFSIPSAYLYMRPCLSQSFLSALPAAWPALSLYVTSSLKERLILCRHDDVGTIFFFFKSLYLLETQ